jgi:hypothetical protein
MNARARTHTHTFYGLDVYCRYALLVAHFGVTYTLPNCQALDIFIARAIYVKVHVLPTCITQKPLSERESEGQVEERMA